VATVLHHRLDGVGDPVVLLHAGVADLRMWEPQLPALTREHQVVACDLRGFGGTPLAPGESYCDADDVLALLDALEVGTFNLVGASYGGSVALQVASAVPERVRRMVLLAPAAGVAEPDEGLRAFWAEENALVEAGDVDGATDLNVRTWLGPDADRAARDLVRRMQRDALVAQLAAGDVDPRELPVDLVAITARTTVLVGAHDFPFFGETARELVRRLPHADLVELPWAGHLPSLERPGEVTTLLLDALSAG
jgi:pimeloyl-ACP methyl ester carboxylesterase